MNCQDVFKLLEKHAPTRETCKTKYQIRLLADKEKKGISGGRLNQCLSQLLAEGKLKEGDKCIKCYYDPPNESFQFKFKNQIPPRLEIDDNPACRLLEEMEECIK
jgi:hypothetical protein